MNYNETISHGGSFLRPLFLLRKYFKGVCQLELNTTKTTQPAPELSSSQAGGTITCCTGTDKGWITAVVTPVLGDEDPIVKETEVVFFWALKNEESRVN